MTREEKQKAIDALKISAPVMAVTQEEFTDYIQTLNKIMDWLEQEPCDDAVSRDAILSKIKEVCFSKEWTQFRVDNGSRGQRDFLINYIEQLPPVTLKPIECDDAVSRQAVLNHIYGINGLEGIELSNVFEKHYADFIKSLPSVTPTCKEREKGECPYYAR